VIRNFTQIKTKDTLRENYDFTAVNITQLTKDVAEYIINDRLQSTPTLLAAWKQKHATGANHDSETLVMMTAMLQDCIGIQGDEIPVHQLEGGVAYYLWRGINQGAFQGSISHLEPPSFSTLDGGADGFEIHNEYAPNCIRLWESKKESSGTSTQKTASKACNQISKRATKYLARIVYSAAGESDASLKAILISSLEKWVKKSQEIGVGISITSEPIGCGVSTISSAKIFKKRMTLPEQIKTMTIAVPNFVSFCKDVRDEIWKGI
jgi:hypothetical protein